MTRFSDIGLVITAALDRELPLEWLAARQVKVRRLRALQSGGLHCTDGPNAGVLVVVTGPGPGNARTAAAWIAANLAPRFVLNLGSAGMLRANTGLGSWVTPRTVFDEQGQRRELDTRLPFAWPDTVTRHVGGALLSVARAAPAAPPASWRAYDYVDMEAAAEAAVFATAGIPFHVLKWLSDGLTADAERIFTASLPAMRAAVTEALGFLDGPGEPAISVVIPAHNRAAHLGRALDSVLAQTLAPAEIIVVDDGSTDATAEVLAGYGAAVRTLHLPDNRGVSAARNAGIAAASGHWIALLDSDDRWRPDKLAAQWDYLLRHPYYEALQCEEIWIRNGRRVNPGKRHAKPVGWIWEPSLRQCLVSPSAVLLHLTLLTRLGGFDPALAACEDYDLWLRLARHHAVGLCATPATIKYGGHDDQLSRRFPAMDRFRVHALLKALAAESDDRYRLPLAGVLRRKLSILAQGSRKRGLTEQTAHYEYLLSNLPSPPALES